MQFHGLDAAEARAFAERWLPAWSGNRPELLASFYTPDTFYADPAIPAGVRGREALLAYFRRLLAHNPDWVWVPARYIWTPGGCVFVVGYWVHPLERCGLLFAPVRLLDTRAIKTVEPAVMFTPVQETRHE